jgi:hypothetical protein
MENAMNTLPTIASKNLPVSAMVTEEGINLIDRLVDAYKVRQQCRVAIRQLEVEERRIEAEFKTASAEIESRTKIRLEELRINRLHREKQLEILGDSLKELWRERFRIMDWIEQAQRDGQYEFANQCTRMLSDARAEQSEVQKLISLPATNEHKQIGG